MVNDPHRFASLLRSKTKQWGELTPTALLRKAKQWGINSHINLPRATHSVSLVLIKMSRVGKNPVLIPDNVKAEVSPARDQRSYGVNQGELTITGPKGKLSHRFHPRLKVEIKEKKILITRQSDSNLDKSIHGLTRSITNNMVIGVTEGFSKQLEIIGVGFRAQIQNNILTLRLGSSHAIDFPIPEGISIELPKPTQIQVSGIDKRQVGEVAAKIRSFYPPEPYKGKGIRYSGEYVRHKAGKAVA